MDKTAEMVVDAIVTDFTDRRGLRQEWEQIDEEIQNEIKGEWMRLVREILGSPNDEFRGGCKPSSGTSCSTGDPTMSMSGHQSARMKSDTWLTPPEILRALGVFDLDPCCPPDMPWPTAAAMISPPRDGLSEAWHGRVWLNPPFGTQAAA